MNFFLCVTSITYVTQSIISIFLLMSVNFYFQLMVTQSKFCKAISITAVQFRLNAFFYFRSPVR